MCIRDSRFDRLGLHIAVVGHDAVDHLIVLAEFLGQLRADGHMRALHLVVDGLADVCLLYTSHSESETYLKRVAAIPGDTYAIRGGVAYLNGEVADEPYATGTEGCEDFEITLAENEYLVLGDNRMESYDSRAADVGVLSRADFIGRARLKVWPLEQFFRPIY